MRAHEILQSRLAADSVRQCLDNKFLRESAVRMKPRDDILYILAMQAIF